MSLAAIRLGVAAVRDEEYFRETVSRIVATRERVKKELGQLGFVFPDSMTNFIFAKHPGVSGKELYEFLRSRNIFVRHFNVDPLKAHLRITMGTDEQMNQMLDCLRVYLG